MNIGTFFQREQLTPIARPARTNPRFRVNATVALVLDNGAVIRGILQDMSTSGAFIKTVERPFGLSPGEEGDLGLDGSSEDPSMRHRFPCEVLRVLRRGIALQFLKHPHVINPSELS